MIGIDVVDLSYLDYPQYSHISHLRRVCSLPEVEFVLKSVDPYLSYSAIWAAKEAAYKCLSNLGMRQNFVPRSIKVEIPTLKRLPRMWRGQSIHSERRLSLIFEMSEAWVMVLAFQDSDEHNAVETKEVRWKVSDSLSDSWTESQSADAVVHDLLSQSRLGHLRISRRNRIPRLIGDCSESTSAWVSVSHHGRFVAGAIRNSGDVVRKWSGMQAAPTKGKGRPVCSTCIA
jgi:phosphopantetheinyl transferase (holo-ACP synthase)